VFNLLNLALIGFLVIRLPRRSGPLLAPA
jgi:hypothetical protein